MNIAEELKIKANKVNSDLVVKNNAVIDNIVQKVIIDAKYYAEEGLYSSRNCYQLIEQPILLKEIEKRLLELGFKAVVWNNDKQSIVRVSWAP